MASWRDGNLPSMTTLTTLSLVGRWRDRIQHAHQCIYCNKAGCPSGHLQTTIFSLWLFCNDLYNPAEDLNFLNHPSLRVSYISFINNPVIRRRKAYSPFKTTICHYIFNQLPQSTTSNIFTNLSSSTQAITAISCITNRVIITTNYNIQHNRKIPC